MVHVEPEIMERIIQLHIRDGRTMRSLADEFGLVMTKAASHQKELPCPQYNPPKVDNVNNQIYFRGIFYG